MTGHGMDALFHVAGDEDVSGWVKLATDFTRHPKAVAAGPTARHLYYVSLMWAGQYATDGHIPGHMLPLLGTDAGISPDEVSDIVEKLIEVGLWERGPDFWVIHDWLEWQTPADQRKALTRPVSKPSKNPSTARDRLTPLTPAAVEVDVDVEVDKDQYLLRYTAEFEKIWAVYPRKLSKKAALRAYAATRQRRVPADTLLTATEGFAKAMTAEKREWRVIKHGSTFFGPDEHWADYLPDGAAFQEVIKQHGQKVTRLDSEGNEVTFTVKGNE